MKTKKSCGILKTEVKNVKKINGTFFEFYHHSLVGGKYMNGPSRAFTDEEWAAKINEIADTGMEYLLLMTSALCYDEHSEIYFDYDLFPKATMTAKAPMDTLFKVAQERGLKIFMACGVYGPWFRPYENMQSDEVKARAFGAMKRLYELYGNSPAFYGWYLPDEVEAGPCFPQYFIDYVNEYTDFGRSIDPKLKMLIAPYGTNKIVADDRFVAQLRELKCDIIAYQDEVGVEKSTPKQTAEYFKTLKAAHDKAGKSRLWADVETFAFEGARYRSALVPADPDRLKAQLESVSPFVDEIIIYIYQCMMESPDAKATFGQRDAVKLYNRIFK
ncbi:MAG: DUF4434 domain-containing protein [Clostridia bacterium]|nr:DUF4434 domain-containing protein [Clostridia bacterium]